MAMRLLRRARYWLQQRRHEAELAEEMRFHRAMLARDRGDDRAAAAFGNVLLAREDARGVWISAGLERIWRDAVYAVRGLRREPVFALTACVTLAAGMAIATTAFSVVDAEVWKPLPFVDPSRLVAVYPRTPGARGNMESISGADLGDWRTRSRAFTDLAGEGQTARRVLRRESAESVLVTGVTANFFTVLGQPVSIGRTLESSDAGRGVLLADRAWRRLFAADPAVVGRALTIDDETLVVVGVLSGALQFTSDPDFFIAIDERSAEFQDRSRRTFNVIGRLRPGVTAAAAQAEMEAIAARIAQDFPDGRAGHHVYVSDLKSFYLPRSNHRPLYFLLFAAGLVMVLTCVNVAALVLARALRRGHEFALRGALGGGRGALLRQLLVEGAVLAIPGGALGLLLTSWILRAFSGFVPPDLLARGTQIPIDVRACLAIFALAALTALVCGLMPATFARRIALNVTLGQGARTAGRSPAQARVRHALLAAQVGITIVLLAAATLFLRSFVLLTQMPMGFDPADAAALRVELAGSRYESEAARRAHAEALLDRTRAIPGVRDAAIGSSTPLGSGPLVFFVVPGRPRPAPSEEPRAILRSVSPDYFRTLEIPLTAGRAFTAADVDGAVPVAVVNQTLARSLFPGEDPVGRTIEFIPGQRSPWARQIRSLLIVGVAGNVKEIGFNEIAFNDIYVPFAQTPFPSFELVVRGFVPPATLVPALRAAASAIDPRLPLSRVTMLDDRVDEALRGDRFNLLIVAAFAVSALLLASVGIFGALAYAVQERRREFGVRIALGAPSSSIVRAAVGQLALVAGAGAAAGLATTVALARLAGNAPYLVPGEHGGLLYGVTTTDPIALASASLVLVAAAIAAGVIPARQATRVDPLTALRAE